MKTKLFLFFIILIGVMTAPVYAGDGPLFRNASLHGRVTNVAGSPVSDVQVQIFSADADNPLSPYGDYYSSTRSDGTFRLDNVPPGQYVVQLSDWKGRYSKTLYPGTLVPADATRVTLRNNEVMHIAPVVQAGGSIAGQVELDTGESFQWFDVTAYRHVDGAGWTEFERVNGQEGDRFELTALPNGPYRLHLIGDVLRGEDRVRIEQFYGNEPEISGGWDVTVDGMERTTITWPLEDRSVVLSGRVLSADGQPLARINVDVYRFTPAAGVGYEWSYPIGYVLTDSDGRWQVTLSEGGHYKAHFYEFTGQYVETYNGNMPTLGGAPVIAVEDEDVDGVDVTMHSGGAISGRLVVEGGTAAAESIHFDVFRWNDHDAYQPVWFYESDFDAAGNFTISRLKEGRYRVHAYAHLRGNVRDDVWLGGGSSLLDGTNLTVTVGETTTIKTIELFQNRGTISGQIVDAQTGAAITTAAVSVFSADNSSPHFIGNFEANSAGYFNVNHLLPGAYTLYVDDEAGRYIGSAELGNEPTATVTVQANANTAAKIELRRGGEINGRITNVRPLEYRSATVLRQVNGEWVSIAGTTIGRDGWYRIGGLPTGSYIVMFRGHSPCCGEFYVAEEFYGDAANAEDAEQIEVTAGQYASGINAAVGNHLMNFPVGEQAVGRISGHVTSESGEPLANVELSLYRSWTGRSGSVWWSYNADMVVTTDADGRYQFDGIVLGIRYSLDTFRIGINGANIGYDTIYYGDTTSFESAESLPLTIDEPHIKGVDVTLAHTGCMLTACE